jgi:methenyltetrahydrofolate cyclohydrolase
MHWQQEEFDMQILTMPMHDFLAATAAKTPTPGGGSVAALCGALAAALGAMAMQYTAGKKAFAAHDAEIRQALAQFQKASAMLQELVAEDVAAYENLSAFLKMPDPQRQNHPDYLAAVVAAIRTPQAIAGFALNVLERCTTLLDKTNRFLLSDLGAAAVYAHATVHAAELNVRVNATLLPGTGEAAATRQVMADLSAKADGLYAPFRAALLRRL